MKLIHVRTWPMVSSVPTNSANKAIRSPKVQRPIRNQRLRIMGVTGPESLRSRSHPIRAQNDMAATSRPQSHASRPKNSACTHLSQKVRKKAGQFSRQMKPQAVETGMSSTPRALSRQSLSKRSRTSVKTSMIVGSVIFHGTLRRMWGSSIVGFDTTVFAPGFRGTAR